MKHYELTIYRFENDTFTICLGEEQICGGAANRLVDVVTSLPIIIKALEAVGK